MKIVLSFVETGGISSFWQPTKEKILIITINIRVAWVILMRFFLMFFSGVKVVFFLSFLFFELFLLLDDLN